MPELRASSFSLSLDGNGAGPNPDMTTLAGVVDQEVYLAVVHAVDGVRFAVSSDSRAVLTHRLAEYVRSRAEDVLWPDDAAHLRTLLATGDLTAAVDCYFWHVGERWDREWLVTSRPLREGP